MKTVKFVISGLLMLMLFINCATTPKTRVYRPWYRVNEGESKLVVPSYISLEVEGETGFLLGDGELINDELKKILEKILLRRGFNIDNNNPRYKVLLKYRSTLDKTLRSLSSFQSQNRSTNIAFSSQNYGVRLASMMTAISNNQSQTASTLIYESESYTHTVLVEFYSNSGKLIWTGESKWNSINLDILDEISLPVQLLLSNLPSDFDHLIKIKEIKESHQKTYYSIFCSEVSFSCPALPNRLMFPRTLKSVRPQTVNIPSCVKNPKALEAYVDLLSNAEYALPTGSSNWDDPLNFSLWSKVTLGGRYSFGNNGEPVNILIKVRGEASKYVITGCQIVSSAEYASFQNSMKKWQKSLKDYFDFYVD